MNVSAWSIRHPIPSLMLFFVLMAGGLAGFRAMHVQNMPDVALPVIHVSVSLPGASPEQVEATAARVLENTLARLQGARHVSMSVTDGAALLSVEFLLETNPKAALHAVRDAVTRIRADLPADMRDVVVTRGDSAGVPIVTYTVASTRMDDEALSWFVDDTVSRRLLAVRGIGTITRIGGVTREVRVELDPAQLLALNASAADISQQLHQMLQDASAGRSVLGGAEQSIRLLSMVKSAEELADVQITLSDGRRIRLGQVATIHDTVAEPRSVALLDGQPVVSFAVSRSRGAGELEVAEGVRGVIDKLKAEHPDVTVVEAFNFVDATRESFSASMMLLYEGAVLAVLVVWLFLRDARATFVCAVALPLSVIPTFAAMHLLGFTLNAVTLLSLSLVVGILVDDAIVEIENIMRHLRQGKTPYQAAMEAADEIGLAVIATTFTLVAVFLPTAFMSGVVGKYFVQFGWTAALAVSFSLLVARVLTPMMAAFLLKPQPARMHEPGWVAGYLSVVRWCLRNRFATVALTLAFLAAGIALVPLLTKGFMPPDDLSQTQVTITLPPGATLAQTREVAESARLALAATPHVRRVHTAIGNGSAGDASQAILSIGLSPRAERSGMSKQAIEARMRDALDGLPGVRVQVGEEGNVEAYTLVLSGEDDAALLAHSQTVARELRDIPGIGNVTSSAGVVKPELIVRPSSERAADLGVTTAAIAETLRVATAGDHEQTLVKLNLATRQVPVMVRLPAAARSDLALLARLPVPGARGPVMLGNVADMTLGSGPVQIERRDRQRMITISAELNGRPLEEVEAQASALPSLARLPQGIGLDALGDAESVGELFSGFSLAMGTGVLCIYVVLVLLFKSLVQPVTIVVALVMAIPGAFIALLATQSVVSMPALIGLIMLMGISAKNSILLVDYAVVARRTQAISCEEALMNACRKRARPIVMTTVAMGAGMLPLALGLGSDAGFRAPMAITVIGGLLTSTALSLVVIPVVFACIDNLAECRRRRQNLGCLRVHAPVSATPPSTGGDHAAITFQQVN